MAFQVDVESSAMRSSAITSSGEIFWVWFLDHESAMTWRNEYIYIYIIWIHGIEWCTHITTLVSARTGLSPAPMFQYTKTLWTFAWKSPFGILASMGSWLLAMLVRWFMRWCVPHETVPHETESQSQRFPTCTDKMKFGCYLKKAHLCHSKKVRPTSARQRCRSGTITFRDASAYLCPFTNFTTRGGKSFRWMWTRSSPRVGLVVSGCGRCHGTHGGGHTTGAHGLGTHHAGIRSGRIASETMIDLIN